MGWEWEWEVMGIPSWEWYGNGNKSQNWEWEGMGMDCTGMGGSGNMKSHSRISLLRGPNSGFSYSFLNGSYNSVTHYRATL